MLPGNTRTIRKTCWGNLVKYICQPQHMATHYVITIGEGGNFVVQNVVLSKTLLNVPLRIVGNQEKWYCQNPSEKGRLCKWRLYDSDGWCRDVLWWMFVILSDLYRKDICMYKRERQRQNWSDDFNSECTLVQSRVVFWGGRRDSVTQSVSRLPAAYYNSLRCGAVILWQKS